MTRLPVAFTILVSTGGLLLAEPGPEPDLRDSGYWTAAQAEAVLSQTQHIRLAPGLAGLSSEELTALAELLAAGEILHDLYLDARHPDARAARRWLGERDERAQGEADADQLSTLFRLFNGPIATTLDNRREAFLPVAPETPGKNVYPPGLTHQELESYLQRHPEARESLLAERAVMRRADEATLGTDLATLARHPGLALLHPGLLEDLTRRSASPDPSRLYAVPYAVAWPEELLTVSAHLRRAADAVRPVDPDFADYLANRARDLLTGDYESGDAAWVTGRFGRLNAQLGSYETYDDALLGVKAFFGASVLLRDEAESDKMAAAVAELQRIENDLPYDHPKKVRTDIPVGVYRVIADFGQARGTNTATILPNDASHARKYGRTILLRHNVMTDPDLFAAARERYAAAVIPDQVDHLTLDGGFQRTLWHEVGHYLGVDRDHEGRPLAVALGPYSDLLEEMKADLVSLFSAAWLHEAGQHDDEALRGIYASGVLRVLQTVRPRREQAYQTMQLMQMNYFLEHDLLSFDPASHLLSVDYERYPQTVESLLRAVLAVQAAGDVEAAGAFVERWGSWRDDLHEPIAANLRAASSYRYRLVHYAALGD